MSNTATRKRSSSNGSAPAPEKPPALDIAQAITKAQVAKAQRVYVDVDGVPRVPTADGTLATVQREKRGDGSLGEYMLAEVRTNKDKTESVTRHSIARVQALKDALAAQGVTILH